MATLNIRNADKKFSIERNGLRRRVPFRDIRSGDRICATDGSTSFVALEDAHMSGNGEYGGTLNYI